MLQLLFLRLAPDKNSCPGPLQFKWCRYGSKCYRGRERGSELSDHVTQEFSSTVGHVTKMIT